MVTEQTDKLEPDSQDEMPVLPEDILTEAGGCGRFQIRMAVVVHLIKTIIVFSTYTLVVFSATPKWYCESNGGWEDDNSSCYNGEGTCEEQSQSCFTRNNTKCKTFKFDPEFNTFVSEFNLVCEDTFIPNLINSIHIAGICTGNLIGGQLADLFGRKLTFFTSLLLLLTFHIVAYFSTSWQWLAVIFYFTGVGCGFYLTVQFILLSEYSLSRWRAWMVGFPSWPMQSSLFALIAWLVHDWKHLQLVTAIMVVPALFSWFVLPESFRWQIAHKQHKKAARTIDTIARFNKVNDSHQVSANVWLVHVHNKDKDKKYTFLCLFKTRYLIKRTLLLMILWASLDIISNGISFGLQTFSGNIYLNLFLFSLTGIPSKTIAIWLQNRFGRRMATALSFSVVVITGLSAGILQATEAFNADIVINVCAFIANAGVAMAWGPLQTLTIESYPTVIRNISFGFLSVIGSISAVIGPQLVYLNSFMPGLLLLICGGMAILSVFATILISETKDQNLSDNI